MKPCNRLYYSTVH